MIKKIITTTTLIAAAAAMANAADLTEGGSILISFSINGGSAKGTFTADYNGANATYNWLKSQRPDSGETWDGLISSTNAITNIGITTDGNGNVGNAGVISAGISGTDVMTTTLYSVFGESAIKGGSTGDPAYVPGGAAQTGNITFSGLTIGQRYKIEVFAGRGNDTNSSIGTYGITGGSNVIANLDAFNGSAEALADGATISASTVGGTPEKTANNWALMTFEFTADSATAAGLSYMGEGKGNVGAIALTAIPEPSMFGLLAGLGALALVGARRRGK